MNTCIIPLFFFCLSDGINTVTSASPSGHIAVWDLDKQQLGCVMRNAHNGSVVGMQFLASQPLMLTSGTDNAIRMWIFDQSDGSARLLRSRCGHSAPPMKLRYLCPGGRGILSAGMALSHVHTPHFTHITSLVHTLTSHVHTPHVTCHITCAHLTSHVHTPHITCAHLTCAHNIHAPHIACAHTSHHMCTHLTSHVLSLGLDNSLRIFSITRDVELNAEFSQGHLKITFSMLRVSVPHPLQNRFLNEEIQRQKVKTRSLEITTNCGFCHR